MSLLHTIQQSSSWDSQSLSPDLTSITSTCDIGSYSVGFECIVTERFLCFIGAGSASSIPISISSFHVSSHSVLFWIQVRVGPANSGALDLKFGEDGFHFSIASTGALSLAFGSISIIAS